MNFQECILYKVITPKELFFKLNLKKMSFNEFEKIVHKAKNDPIGSKLIIKFRKQVGDKKRDLISIKESKLGTVNKAIFKALKQLEIPEFVLGGISGRSHFQNACVHMQSKSTIVCDIYNFFPSTKSNLIYDFFRNKMHCSNEVAKYLVILTSVENHEQGVVLPQGFSTSTILSYLINASIFNNIYEYVNKYNNSSRKVILTLYVDDMTFSSTENNDFKILWECVNYAKQELKKHKYKIKDSKTKEFAGLDKLVTGIKVCKKGKSLNATEDFNKRLNNAYYILKKLAYIKKDNVFDNNILKTKIRKIDIVFFDDIEKFSNKEDRLSYLLKEDNLKAIKDLYHLYTRKKIDRKMLNNTIQIYKNKVNGYNIYNDTLNMYASKNISFNNNENDDIEQL